MLALPLLVGSCKTVGFKEVYMSRDSAGKLRAKTFSTENTEIFCIIRYSSGRDDAELKTYITTPNEDDPVELASDAPVLFSKGDGQFALQLATVSESPEGKRQIATQGPWPEGTYRLDFFIDDEKEDSISFNVQAPEEE